MYDVYDRIGHFTHRMIGKILMLPIGRGGARIIIKIDQIASGNVAMIQIAPGHNLRIAVEGPLQIVAEGALAPLADLPVDDAVLKDKIAPPPMAKGTHGRLTEFALVPPRVLQQGQREGREELKGGDFDGGHDIAGKQARFPVTAEAIAVVGGLVLEPGPAHELAVELIPGHLLDGGRDDLVEELAAVGVARLEGVGGGRGEADHVAVDAGDLALLERTGRARQAGVGVVEEGQVDGAEAEDVRHLVQDGLQEVVPGSGVGDGQAVEAEHEGADGGAVVLVGLAGARGGEGLLGAADAVEVGGDEDDEVGVGHAGGLLGVGGVRAAVVQDDDVGLGAVDAEGVLPRAPGFGEEVVEEDGDGRRVAVLVVHDGQVRRVEVDADGLVHCVRRVRGQLAMVVMVIVELVVMVIVMVVIGNVGLQEASLSLSPSDLKGMLAAVIQTMRRGQSLVILPFLNVRCHIRLFEFILPRPGSFGLCVFSFDVPGDLLLVSSFFSWL